MAQAWVPVFFAASRYLRYKSFDMVWGYGPPRRSPQNQFFERLNLRCQCFLISAQHFLEMINVVVISRVPPPRDPLKTDPPKINFLLP